MKSTLLVMVAGICAASLMNASAITTTSFGTMSGATFGGTGIPNDAVEMTTISGIPVPNSSTSPDTLTIGLSATPRFTAGELVNNGSGTYFADPGAGAPNRAKWNFDFDVNSALGNIDAYHFILTYGREGGTPVSLSLALFSDSTGGPGSFQNSENLGFASLGAPIGFDVNASAIYDFTIDAYEGDAHLGSDTIHVNVGNVPDGGSTAGLLGVCCIGLYAVKRRVGTASVQ